MTTWMRCHWDDEDIWFYFEVDAEGWVTRQVELQGPERVPLAAAALAEWDRAYAAGTWSEYERRYGGTAELPVSEWEGHVPEWLAADAFEAVWRAARRDLAARSR
ncbi:hypothetical protein [Streptomyces paludis]|uniref:Uncharacterized protein n=1 Tax=Streptomyces paludis TaxID=2282738 RepID=A0A345HSQ8_9ACTN|nr:hypothetical protein [Streptomyces paludis]AXG79732.1 hypothetical protein DVK44_21090 [Streptomyces paludis]